MRTTSLRLPERLLDDLDRVARAKRVSRSQVVREAVASYCAEAVAEPTGSRAERVARLVTYPGSGRGDLARNAERYLRERFDAGRRDRSR